MNNITDLNMRHREVSEAVYTSREVAKIFHVTVSTVHQWVKDNPSLAVKESNTKGYCFGYSSILEIARKNPRYEMKFYRWKYGEVR